MITPSSIDKLKRYKQRCQRRLRTLFSPKTPLNFSSTDYLNLASHPYVKEQGILYSMKWGSGCLPTRMLPSYEKALKRSEERLAHFLGTETVTYYESDPTLLKSISCIDDTLTFTVLGPHGFGLSAQNPEIPILSGGFSKSFGTYVSYIACSKEMKSELFDRFPLLHKEQYIPPLFLGMIDATIQLLPSLQSERKRLFALKQQILTSLKKLGFLIPDTKLPYIVLPHSLHPHLLENSIIPLYQNDTLTLLPNLTLSEKDLSIFISALSTHKEPLLVEAL